MKKAVLLLFLLFASVKGYAANPLVNPVMIVDPVRSLISWILKMLHVTEDPLLGAWLDVVQQEVDALVSGDESYLVDQGTGSAAPAVPTEAYDYVNENILASSQKTPYEPLNSRISPDGDMEAVVKELFFAENTDENPLTEAKRKEVEKRRTAYLTALAKHYIQTAYEVQQKVMENMDSVGSDINANGSIGSVSGIDQTWKAVNKTLIADIGLQIELMELDAARFLGVQPIELMTETKPANRD